MLSTDPTVIDGIAYFGGSKPTGGSSILWRSDGTAAGTYTLGTTPPGVGAYPQGFTSYKNAVYYFTKDSASAGGYALWKTDGTTGGTQVVKSPVTPANGSAPDQVIIANNLLFFRGGSNATGHEPWKSDGTLAGTVQVKDIYAGSTNSMNRELPSEWVSFDGYAYFVADDGKGGVAGRQIWKTNGTTTTMLPFISNASVAPNPNSLVVFGGSLFFKVRKDGHGIEWWTTNGSTYSDGPAIDLYPGTTGGVENNSSNFGSYMVSGNSLYFFGRSPEVGWEVFRAGVPLVVTSQPQPKLVAVGSSFSFSVAANSSTAISYLWRRNGVNISGATSSTYSQSTAALSHAGAYQAFLSSNDGAATSNTANLGVADLAVAPKSAQAGGTVSLTVNTAAPSGVALTYVWKRGTSTLSSGPTASGGTITGATSATITITKLGTTETGNYTCTVSMGALSLTTTPAAVGIAATPLISAHPENRYVKSSTSVSFSVVVSNPTSVTYQWKKNGANINGATASAYAINSTSISDGGEYHCTVSNPAGSANSNTARLVVVSQEFSTTTTFGTSSLTMSVKVGKPSTTKVTYAWMKGESDISDGLQSSGALFTGSDESTLVLTNITPSDEGLFSCRVRAIGQDLTVPVFQLYVRDRPIITNTTTPECIVSEPWFWQLTSAGGATRYKVSGLPKGLTYNAATGLISGTPEVYGYFKIIVTAGNEVGVGVAKKFDLYISPLETVSGSYSAMIARNSTVNGDLGGILKLTVLPNGTYTGSIANGKSPIRFKGRVTASLTSDPEITQVFERVGLLDLTLAVTLAESGELTGTLSDGANTAAIDGGRHVWNKKNPVVLIDGTYNTTLSRGTYTSLVFPQGRGWLQIKVASHGAVTGFGRLGDNSKFTFSSTMMKHSSLGISVLSLFEGGRFPLFGLLYSGRGSLTGQVSVAFASASDAAVTATCQWYKMPSKIRPERNYGAGFSIDSIVLAGSLWQSTRSGDMIMGWQSLPNNIGLQVTQGGITEAAYASSFPLNFTLANKGTTTSDKLFNITSCVLKVDPKTGLFKGSFSLKDPAWLSSLPALKRHPSFTGIIVPHLNRGFGVFNLEQLPMEGETLKTSPILSGRVDVIPQ